MDSQTVRRISKRNLRRDLNDLSLALSKYLRLPRLERFLLLSSDSTIFRLDPMLAYVLIIRNEIAKKMAKEVTAEPNADLFRGFGPRLAEGLAKLRVTSQKFLLRKEAHTWLRILISDAPLHTIMDVLIEEEITGSGYDSVDQKALNNSQNYSRTKCLELIIESKNSLTAYQLFLNYLKRFHNG